MCTTTSTPTTPMNAKNSAPCEKEESADALTVLTGATAEEEEGTRDAGKIVAHVKASVTNLARTAGVTCLARGTGGTSLVRIALMATQACRRCRLSQEGMKTATKTRGLGLPRASRNRLHPGRSSSPSLSTYLQAVCSRSERSSPQARSNASPQVVGLHHHV